MALSEDKRNLILISPMRNPPTTAHLKARQLCFDSAENKGIQELVRIQLDGVAEVLAQYTIPKGGDTRNEFPRNLLKNGTENWNKWCQFESPTAWIMIDLKSPYSFQGIGFKSANDFEKRDPNVAEIFVFD